MTPPKSPPQPAVSVEQTLPLERWTEWARRDDWHQLFVGSDIRQMLGEIHRLSAAPPADGVLQALDGYRAAVSWIGADSWDGCSECIDILKAARASDVDWDWAADHDRIAAELKRIRHFAGTAAPKAPTAPVGEAGDWQSVRQLLRDSLPDDPTYPDHMPVTVSAGLIRAALGEQGRG